MDLTISDHFEFIILKQLEKYSQAEQRLTDAVLSKDNERIKLAEYDALRIGTNAIWHVHHYAEIVFMRQYGDAEDNRVIRKFRKEIEENHCVCLITGKKTNDISIIGDAADALKHSILTRKNPPLLVSNRDQVLVISREYGEGGYGTDDYGGIEQVVILCNDKTKRPLTTCLKNVVGAWRDYLMKHGHLIGDHKLGE